MILRSLGSHYRGKDCSHLLQISKIYGGTIHAECIRQNPCCGAQIAAVVLRSHRHEPRLELLHFVHLLWYFATK